MEERSRGPVKKRPRTSNSFSSASADSSPSMSPIAIDSQEPSGVTELMVSNSTRSDNSTGPSNHMNSGATITSSTTGNSSNTMSTRDSDNNSSSNSTSNRVTSMTRCKRRNQSTAGVGGNAYEYEEEETPINNTTTSSLVTGEMDECDDDHVDGVASGVSRRMNSSPASSTSHVSIMSPVDVNVNSPERAASATPSVTKSPHSMSPRSPVMSPRSNASPVQQSNGSGLASNSHSHHHHHHHQHHHSQQQQQQSSSSLHQAAGGGEGHMSGHQSSGNTSGVTSSVSNSHHRFHPYASPELHLPPPLGGTVFHPASLSHFMSAGSGSPSGNGHLTASHLGHLAAASQSALLSCSSPPNQSPGATASNGGGGGGNGSTTNSTAAAAAAVRRTPCA